MSNIQDYAKGIPIEIRKAIKGLDCKTRQAIIICLLENGELSFSELRDKIGISKANLNFHLKELIKAMLVEHYYRHVVGNENFSFYSTTTFGQTLIESLVQTLTPSISMMETTELTESLEVNFGIRAQKVRRVLVGASGRGLQVLEA